MPAKRVVLTGATGFIGANLARRLLADGHDVSVLLRPGCSPWRLEGIRGDLRVHDVDLTDATGVAAAIRQVRPDWIFNLAAHGAYSWQTELHAMLMTNLLGTVNLLEAAVSSGFEAFVQTGTSSEYGAKDHSPPEVEWLEPNSHYAVTKASATLFCRYTGQTTGLGVRTLRLYSVYGPWEEPTRLMPTLVMRGIHGELPSLVSPSTARDYVYVDDVVDATIAAAATPGQEPGAVYNVGTGRQTTLSEVVDLVRAEMGIAAEPVWGTMAPRTWDTDVWVADIARINAQLRWEPRYALPEGFRLLIGWLADCGDIRDRYASISRL
jgi:UDP-glucose 4-epimerase